MSTQDFPPELMPKGTAEEVQKTEMELALKNLETDTDGVVRPYLTGTEIEGAKKQLATLAESRRARLALNLDVKPDEIARMKQGLASLLPAAADEPPEPPLEDPAKTRLKDFDPIW